MSFRTQKVNNVKQSMHIQRKMYLNGENVVLTVNLAFCSRRALGLASPEHTQSILNQWQINTYVTF